MKKKMKTRRKKSRNKKQIISPQYNATEIHKWLKNKWVGPWSSVGMSYVLSFAEEANQVFGSYAQTTCLYLVAEEQMEELKSAYTRIHDLEQSQGCGCKAPGHDGTEIASMCPYHREKYLAICQVAKAAIE
jgi:hypothetical protein